MSQDEYVLVKDLKKYLEDKLDNSIIEIYSDEWGWIELGYSHQRIFNIEEFIRIKKI